MALAPLLIAIVRSRGHRFPIRRACQLGLLTGAVYFGGTLYWLVETMTTFGGLATPLAVFAAAILVLYLSLFPAAFAAAFSALYRAFGAVAFLLAPAVWVSTELGRQYVWDGFPWALLGYSQITVLPVVQVVSAVGVYGLSGLLAAVSAAVAFVIVDGGRRRWVAAAGMAAFVAACVVWGAARLRDDGLVRAGDHVRVAVLQGNIAQEDKWNPDLRDAITDRYIAMTRTAIDAGATFVIWPESSTPFYFEHDLYRGGTIRRLAREGNVTLLIGSDQVEPLRTAQTDRVKERYYNAAFLVRPDGGVGAVYRKMHLVPFGEYVPLATLLFFVGTIVEAVSPFTPGEDPVLLPVDGRMASTAICYEVIFPSLIRRFVLDGSQLLTTITNDAWYGRSSAAYQHWDQAAMRSIEQGRYLARAANTGISGFVDPYGRVLKSTALFEEALVVEDIRFLTHRTIYNRIGDVAAWGSLAATLGALLAAWTLERRAARAAVQ